VQRLLFVLAVVAFAACSKATNAAATLAADAGIPVPGAQQPAPKPVPAELPDVLAKVNGESITKTEFEKAVLTVERQNGGATVPPDQRDQVYRGVLEQLIGFKLLVQESKARNVTVADTDIDARMAQVRSQFPSEEAFKQALDQQKITVDQLRADARSEMQVTKMLQTEVDPKVAVSPAKLQEFYDKNPERFKQTERARASHILLRLPEQADEAAKAAVRTKATEVLKEARAGKDFAALAKQYSQDTGSAPGGGDLNYFQKGQMVPPFDQAVWAMKIGDISDLVETQFGFHIIKLTDKQAERTVPLDEVRPQVQQFLENQSRQEATQALIKSLAAKGKVEIFI